ncbi:hypothetical protein V9T40_001973 [Parthenolecanium corni]|uniref:Uncharacterized protein n=1 Tax=Parthenolecanium corni TaxID=536013 RepID=A0AAN9TFQ9_9HEMI
MRFFFRKKCSAKLPEPTLNVPCGDTTDQMNIRSQRWKNRCVNQEKVLDLLHSSGKFSPKNTFSHYSPLPAIGTELNVTAKKPTLQRQRTYTVLNPIIVKGPIPKSSLYNQSTKIRIKRKESLQSIKNKCKNKKKFQPENLSEMNGTVFWFPV